MNCNVQVICKIIFNNKCGFILETVFSYKKFAVEKKVKLTKCHFDEMTGHLCKC
jgi:hypothetical protein